MKKDLKNLRLDDVKVNAPKRTELNKSETEKKSSEAKTIRVSLENYEFLKRKAFEQDVSIKELADSTLDELRKNN